MRSLPRLSFKKTRAIPLAILVLTASVWSAPAWSAFVTLHETKVETIFSDANPDAPAFMGPIDIRYRAVQEFVGAHLLNIDNTTEFFELSDADLGVHYPTIKMFYVNKVKWCGDNGGFAGCAIRGGNMIALNSADAASNDGDEVIAHELGHTLGLRHGTGVGGSSETDDDSGSNLMTGNSNDGEIGLTATQISLIFNSPLLQEDAMGYFLEIQPILVVAASVVVPLPGALVFLMSALVPAGLFSRRRAA